MSLELISFKLCPYVQRSVITLLYKEVPFDITYIDLHNPPEWFQEISPLGKVPVLKVNGVVLFESAVINEYIDETTGSPLHPTDPLLRAQNRAWIEYFSTMLMTQFQMVNAETEEAFEAKKSDMLSQIQRLESQLGAGPYFNGQDFSLADTAAAPIFTRMVLMNERLNYFDPATAPNFDQWGQTLLAMPAVKKSVVDDFDELYINFMKNMGSYISSRI